MKFGIPLTWAVLAAGAGAAAVLLPPAAQSHGHAELTATGSVYATDAPSMAALVALDDLPVKGRAARTGYSRAQFGAAWVDTDRNGCDTRNDVLRRDLTSSVVASNGCVVLSGTLPDPYSGSGIAFTRGEETSEAVQIDHVVALRDAWVTGAQMLTSGRRTAFANDPLNLLAANGSLNDQKGASDAASWLPPRKAFRCDYVARQVAVKRAYGLWVTAAERAAIARILSGCPNEVLPVRVSFPPRGRSTPTPTVTSTAIPTLSPLPTESPTPTTSSTPTTSLDPRFSTCREANAAGYGPYLRGRDPEYYWYRDADGDGIDCER